MACLLSLELAIYRRRDRLLLRSLSESTHREPEAPSGRSTGTGDREDGQAGTGCPLAVPVTSLFREHTLTTLIGTIVQLLGPRLTPPVYLVTPHPKGIIGKNGSVGFVPEIA
jgi:hypothetical protein